MIYNDAFCKSDLEHWVQACALVQSPEHAFYKHYSGYSVGSCDLYLPCLPALNVADPKLARTICDKATATDVTYPNPEPHDSDKYSRSIAAAL